jgi:hypothetical protein
LIHDTLYKVIYIFRNMILCFCIYIQLATEDVSFVSLYQAFFPPCSIILDNSLLLIITSSHLQARRVMKDDPSYADFVPFGT